MHNLKVPALVLLSEISLFDNFGKIFHKLIRIYSLLFSPFQNVFYSSVIVAPYKVNITNVVTMKSAFYVSAFLFQNLFDSLEKLNKNDDSLIRKFATKIILSINDEELFPSWFLRECLHKTAQTLSA